VSDRIFNFSPGPAVLPEPVLRKAQAAVWNYAGSGIGILEHSHRGPEFTDVIERAEASCRQLAGIPDDYAVLFLQGGASLQFSMVAQNLLGAGQTADYLNTGEWSKKAIKEAKKVGAVHVAASSEDENFSYIPPADAIRWSEAPAYVHMTSNNTIFGTEWAAEPTPPTRATLVCDASSDIFSRPVDIGRYGLIYAGAQKNLGPSGVCLVIMKKSLAERAPASLPTMLQYRTHIDAGSLYNTPNTFGIYVIGEVFAWLLEQGGLGAIADDNRAKAKLLYDYLDDSAMFSGTARPDSRSLMNVTFRAKTEALEKAFIADAEAAGLSGLKGHRSVGGMRASIYNAFPEVGVKKLVSFMKEFERRHG
jgi:phosphoserine aminotransferase